MYGKSKLTLVAMAAAAVMAVGAQSATAVTISNGTGATSGSVTVSGTAPSAGRIVATSGTGVPINCTTASVAGAVTLGSYPTLPAAVGTARPVFGTCTGPSGLAVTISCVTTSTLNLTGPPVAGTTPGTVTGIDCTVTYTALGCSAHITGSVKVSYTNPAGGNDGFLTVLGPSTSGNQSLPISASTCAPVTGLINGVQVMFGAPVGPGTGLADLTYVLGGVTGDQPIVS